MTRKVRPAPVCLCAAFVLALLLAGVLPLSQPRTAHAQSYVPEFKIEAIHTGANAEVYEGAQAEFRLTRETRMDAASVTVNVQVWEPNMDGRGNPTRRTLQFPFHDYETGSGRTRQIMALAYVDGVNESTETNHTLQAKIVPSTDGSYTIDSRNQAHFDILDPPGTLPEITVESEFALAYEGTRFPFILTRTGDTASPLTVSVEIDDPNGFTRGNHWDPAPVLPTTAEFATGSATAEVEVPTKNDHRDLSDSYLWLEVSPGDGYLLGQMGLETKDRTIVRDADTRQELELNFSKNGTNNADLEEGQTLEFSVKRRQSDIANPVRFTVRVETDRGGADYFLDDWTEDPGTGRLFKDYDFQISGSQTEAGVIIPVAENGVAEDDWNYWASIRPLEDVDGTALDSTVELQYWTVKTGFREIDVTATDTGETDSRSIDQRSTISLEADATSITEGEMVTFTLTRGNGTVGELIVGVTADDPGGFLEGNYASEAVEVPTSIVFAPGEITKEIPITPPDDWRDIPDSTLTFTVAAELGYEIVGSPSLTVQVADNDVAPQVQISFNHAEVDEGEDLVLTIARIGEDKNPLKVALALGPVGGPVGNQTHAIFGLDIGEPHLTITFNLPDDQFKGPDTHYQVTLHPGNPEFWVPHRRNYHKRSHPGQRPLHGWRQHPFQLGGRGTAARLLGLPRRPYRRIPRG